MDSILPVSSHITWAIWLSLYTNWPVTCETFHCILACTAWVCQSEKLESTFYDVFSIFCHCLLVILHLNKKNKNKHFTSMATNIIAILTDPTVQISVCCCFRLWRHNIGQIILSLHNLISINAHLLVVVEVSSSFPHLQWTPQEGVVQSNKHNT